MVANAILARHDRIYLARRGEAADAECRSRARACGLALDWLRITVHLGRAPSVDMLRLGIPNIRNGFYLIRLYGAPLEDPCTRGNPCRIRLLLDMLVLRDHHGCLEHHNLANRGDPKCHLRVAMTREDGIQDCAEEAIRKGVPPAVVVPFLWPCRVAEATIGRKLSGTRTRSGARTARK